MSTVIKLFSFKMLLYILVFVILVWKRMWIIYMKYIVLIGDGMADVPLRELGGKTPLQAAEKPGMNNLAQYGINGMVSTVPEDMTPESDTANLALMGYDPKVYSRGRSPLEALSMGIDMQPEDTAIRANIVALSDDGLPYEQKIMLDHSADEIPTEEARVLIEALNNRFGNENLHFYTGVSYRHCLIWKDCPDFTDFTRPHDILGKRITEYLPSKPESVPMRRLMSESFDLLNNHPVNKNRAARGLKKANSLWLWSPGKKPSLPSFKEKTGLNASVVCAADLIKGIGLCAGMRAPFIEGATGNLNTNYKGKLETAIRELESGADLVYIHIEAPDECGHRGEIDNKIKAIELIDSQVLVPLLKYMDSHLQPYKILLLPDHPTPIYVRTHTIDPVPFVVYSSNNKKSSLISIYDEQSGVCGGVYFDKGELLMDYFIKET